jgi:tetratricopeptide (TPR) repeat protein
MWAIVVALFFFQSVDYPAQGLKALEEGKYDVAVAAFQKAIEADSKDYYSHFNLAMAYSLLNKDAEAVAEYRKTLELKPGLYEAQLNEGVVLMRGKDAAGALPLLEAASGQKPQEFRPLYFLAEAQLATGAFDKAEVSFKAALAIDPKSGSSELGLAHALVAQKKLAEADPHYRQAGKLDPRYHEFLLELAKFYEEVHQPEEAIKIYREFPDNAAAQEHMGQLMLDNRQYKDAIPKLETAFKSAPSQANRTALAAAYLFSGDLDQALPLLEQSVAAEPNNYDLHMMYARALRDKKLYLKAANEFASATKLKPTDAKTWSELGSMLYLIGDLQPALAAFDKARDLGENTAGNWFLRAIILDKAKQLKPAVDAYQHFLALSQGKNPDQEFQARQRVRIMEKELEKR